VMVLSEGVTTASGVGVGLAGGLAPVWTTCTWAQPTSSNKIMHARKKAVFENMGRILTGNFKF